ncbi:copper homeostasis protein [Spiroplasma helicoides]|uniref:Copper homeostasis protein cutC homolog n=1 Tax=Spiroplasma helicoides TaxID=216938 RepID=A0A1B3SLP2_9MOLU|nr:copper homeostasis protein CutC [Spiroplasma helicoides]AOG60844.1 copper homeostasis protein [Spiroplasma helicoides]
MFLEVIAKSIDDVKKINKTKASRIELCKDLEVGGLTPDYELIDNASKISKLPVNVIVRPTSRDFIYTSDEKKQILKDIEYIKKTKANGIVFGALNQDKTIDIDLLKKVIKAKEDLQITFHKAFDEVTDFLESYKLLAYYKVDCVLTSGGSDLNKGFVVLESLKNLKLNTKILIGGGVNEQNFSKTLTISNYIHIGRMARFEHSWDKSVDDHRVNELINIFSSNNTN